MKCIDSKPKYKRKGKRRQCREFYGDLNCGLLRLVLINPSIKFYSNSLMMSTNVKITKMLLFVQVHFLNFPSPLCKRRQLLNKFDFQTRLFLITSCFERNLAALY